MKVAAGGVRWLLTAGRGHLVGKAVAASPPRREARAGFQFLLPAKFVRLVCSLPRMVEWLWNRAV
jgi:hypothetical protein